MIKTMRLKYRRMNRVVTMRRLKRRARKWLKHGSKGRPVTHDDVISASLAVYYPYPTHERR